MNSLRGIFAFDVFQLVWIGVQGAIRLEIRGVLKQTLLIVAQQPVALKKRRRPLWHRLFARKITRSQIFIYKRLQTPKCDRLLA